LREPMFVT